MTRSGPDGTPPQGHDFADYVRRALHAAADQVDPHPDGLERIRARVQSGPAYASKHSAVPESGGFLADMVRRLNALRGGQEAAQGGSAHGPRARSGAGRHQDWRERLLRPALAAALKYPSIWLV